MVIPDPVVYQVTVAVVGVGDAVGGLQVVGALVVAVFIELLVKASYRVGLNVWY
jgi:hypothetical protein